MYVAISCFKVKNINQHNFFAESQKQQAKASSRKKTATPGKNKAFPGNFIILHMRLDRGKSCHIQFLRRAEWAERILR